MGAAVCRANGAKVAVGAATNARVAQSRATGAGNGSRSGTHWSGCSGLGLLLRGHRPQHFCEEGDGQAASGEDGPGRREGSGGHDGSGQGFMSPNAVRPRRLATHQDGEGPQAHHHRHHHRVCTRRGACAVAAGTIQRATDLQVLVPIRAAAMRGWRKNQCSVSLVREQSAGLEALRWHCCGQRAAGRQAAARQAAQGLLPSQADLPEHTSCGR